MNLTYRLIWRLSSYGILPAAFSDPMRKLKPFNVFLLDLSYLDNSIWNIEDGILYFQIDPKNPNFANEINEIRRSKPYINEYVVNFHGETFLIIRVDFPFKEAWNYFCQGEYQKIYLEETIKRNLLGNENAKNFGSGSNPLITHRRCQQIALI